MRKIKLDFQAYEKLKGQFVAVPKYDDDYAEFGKINGDFKCKVSQSRNYENHKYLFRVIEKCIENGIVERLIDKGIISYRVYSSLFMIYKTDTEVILYLLKWFLLPLIEKVLPNGIGVKEVQSISFEKMDNIDFLSFRAKCINWLSDVIGVESSKLMEEVNND
jgi:hypothetical protein